MCICACVCLVFAWLKQGWQGMTWAHCSEPKIEQRCLSAFAWHQHKPPRQTHTRKNRCYFGNCLETEKMQQTQVDFLCFTCYFVSVYPASLFSLSVPSWRRFVRWWRWSRPDMWCWRITCRTTSGSSSSSSWGRCLPRTPEWRTCSHPVCQQILKQEVSLIFSF